MKKKFCFLLSLLCAVLVLGGCGILDTLQGFLPTQQPPVTDLPIPDDTSEPSLPPGEAELTPAPDFAMEYYSGNTANLSDFVGKPVILNFWASWCGPCKSEMPDFQTAYEKHGDEIHFMMVNLTDGTQETVDKAYTFIEQQGYTFPVYYDTAMEGAAAYGVNAIPVTYFIDARGNLVAWGQGMLSEADLQYGIDLLLNPEG